MMVEKNIRFQVNQDDIQVENDSNDGNDSNGDQDVPNPPQNAQARQIVVPVGTPGAPQTTLAFKVEQSKIPKFFGQKGKDNITAIVFIRKIDDLARTNRYDQCGQHTQRFRWGLVICNGGNVGLDCGSTYMDKFETQISTPIRNTDR